jgi:hypothetical protein
MNANATTECAICAETYNKQRRAKINCMYCDMEACTQCCQTWILSETIPRCMNNDCNREWTIKFLSEQFTATFLTKQYKPHREQIIFDQERALLPATQVFVENRIHAERIGEQIDAIQQKMHQLDLRRRRLVGQRYQLEHPSNDIPNERRAFVRACPAPDCRGFLSTQWKCGLCEQWTCPHCNELKGGERDEDEHVCQPDNVASATLMRQDTKSCPTCGVGIFRIMGCDQMFCTQCHTAFSWRTGRIETNIHNPHYFEWLQRQDAGAGGGGVVPRNPMEIRCGRLIDVYFVRGLHREFTAKGAMSNDHKEQSGPVIAKCRSLNHLYAVELPRFRVDPVLNNQELRIKYMRNLITEEKFKTQLQRDNKKHRNKREIFDVIHMVNQMCTDILYRFLDDVQRADWNHEYHIIDEIYPLLAYANECLMEIGRTYHSLPWKFTNEIELKRERTSS